MAVIYTHFGIISLELNIAPGYHPKVYMPTRGIYMSQRGQGIAETPIVSKGLSLYYGRRKLVHSMHLEVLAVIK